MTIERARMADKANTNGIKHGVANLLGMGKYAAIEKRNKEREESVPKEKQRLHKQFAAAVRQEVEKAVAPYEQQKNADRLLINALQSKVHVSVVFILQVFFYQLVENLFSLR